MHAMRTTHKIFFGKSQGKIVGRRRRKWLDYIKMGHKDTRHVGVDWIQRAQWRFLVSTVMDLRVP
jgi:hypothetical protein